MTQLMQIQAFIQAYVMAISSILGAEVTIVDESLIRVGGTGPYQNELGEKISHDSFFKQILTSGAPGIIEDVRAAFACSSCDKRESCKELANLGYPIFLGDKAIGVIGIIAFREEERKKLLQDRGKLEDFLKYMSILMESKLLTEQYSSKLEQQIHEVISLEKRRGGADLLGNSPVIQSILSLVDRVSRSNSTIMITGESGTGKELLAKRIHHGSQRRKKLMLSLNCAAIPEPLVESELFGYNEGAFTGAKKGGQIGKFELAHQSTLFLDEIGELPLPTQTKLLRVLQEQEITRVGGKESIPIDVRVICATNRDLGKMVEEGAFRQDLYYRLNVIPIELPPLRERREDIPIFVRHFIQQFNQVLHKHVQGIDPLAEEALVRYSWPGNVRELKNIIEYLVNILVGDTIRFGDLPAHISNNTAGMGEGTLKEIMGEYERKLLGGLICGCSTVEEKNALAARLGISRATLYRKLSEYKL